MFIFDVETLGVESDAVILSMALIHFDPDSNPSFDDLMKNAFFVKIDAQDQIVRLRRSIEKSTMEWWSKQCLNVKIASLKPSEEHDVKAEDAIEKMRLYVKQFPDYANQTVWARGSLDQVVLDSLVKKVGAEPIFNFNKWRDVRTAVDFLTGSSNGYCEVDYEGFNPSLHVTKHNPIDDCAYDVMMLLYGKKEN
jgi:hypothetical protein